MSKVIVIGGGASGLVAAIFAVRNNNDVTILEKNNICGKKILATGNGRCNYWNEDQSVDHYRTSYNIDYVKEIINEKNRKEILDFFDEIGIKPKIKNGYYYPFSNQAVSMQNALILEAKKNGVNIKENFDVKKIHKQKDEFVIKSQNGDIIYGEKIILATGSKAAPKTGSDGFGYEICKNFGHRIIKPLPALVQLKTEGKFLKDWEGVRADVSVDLIENEKNIAQEVGEIQLTNYGVSGICIFNLSGRIARGIETGKNEYIKINFLHGLNIGNSEDEYFTWMENRNKKVKNRTIQELLEGILNYKLVNVILKKSNIKNRQSWNEISEENKKELIKNMIEFKLEIIGTNSFDKAQVCSGGVNLEEISYTNMESKKEKNLYITGEILDVDGDCGGYNLEWAWITGMIAGKNV